MTSDDIVGGERSPLLLVGIGIGATLAVFVASSIFAILMVFGCGGDGGSPYVARDSAHGGLCASGAIDAWSFAIWIVPPVLVLAGVVLSAMRRRFRELLIGLGGALALFVVTLVAFAVIPDECTEEQKEAGARCETFN